MVRSGENWSMTTNILICCASIVEFDAKMVTLFAVTFVVCGFFPMAYYVFINDMVS